MNIVEFLEARIAEEEDNARRAAFGWGAAWDSALDNDEVWSFVSVEGKKEMVGSEDADVIIHIAYHDPARVLAECAAKRKIIAECRPSTLDDLDSGEDDQPAPMWVARSLAAVYKDHPDYQQEWAA